MNSSPRSLKRWLWLLIGCLLPLTTVRGQSGYQASWHRGLLGTQLNPASVEAAPHARELLLGGVDLYAGNSHYATHQHAEFLAAALWQGLTAAPDQLPLFTRVDQPGFEFQGQELLWSGSQRNRLLGPGWAQRLEVDPDWFERGLVRRSLYVQVMREEALTLRGVPLGLAQAYAQGQPLSAMANNPLASPQLALEVRQWDAVQAGYGLTLGRGTRQLHLAAGGKLLSMGAFSRLQVDGLNLNPGANATGVQASSITWAYNPGFAAISRAGNPRRYQYFENSWGIAGHLGVIFQSLDYNRRPKWEVGASVQDFGVVQIWNLRHRRYEQVSGSLEPDQLSNLTQGAAGLDGWLEKFEGDTTHLAEGITERLPLWVTTHGKFRLPREGWALQIDAQAAGLTTAAWQGTLRTTLAYEGKLIQCFFPVAADLAFAEEHLRLAAPRVGLIFSLGDLFIFGSDDLLGNLIQSGLRTGVSSARLFAGVHLPLQRDP